MTGYTILRTENVSKILKNKPRWVICTVYIVSMIILIVSAVAAGILIGYTYCYVENRSGFKTANATLTKGVQMHETPFTDYSQVNDKKTINKALYNLVQKILKIGHTLWDDDRYSLLWTYDAKKVEHETTL